MRYRDFKGLKLSELGIGTYLGELDEDTDKRYSETIRIGVERGINVIDTAINYRYMKSERVIGNLIDSGDLNRTDVIISTKGGYIPFDADANVDPREFFEENFIKTGLIDTNEMTPQGHYLGKDFLRWCFDKSLENLKTDYIDVYFLHNPEEQLLFCERDEFYRKLRESFELLEDMVAQGKLRFYGLATWNGFRVSPSARQYLNLREIYEIAGEVAGGDSHFRFIQLPYNLGMHEAFSLNNQSCKGSFLSTLECAANLGLYVYTSASIYQGQVLGRVPERLKEFFGMEKDVHVALQFVRSTPGVGTALVGMSRVDHLKENLEVLNVEPVSADQFLTLFK